MQIANPEMFQMLMGHLEAELTETQREIARWWFHHPSNPRALQILGGERSGKSFLTAFLMLGSIDPLKPGDVWLVGPDYWQARPEFKYLYDVYQSADLIESAHMPEQNAMQWVMKLKDGPTFLTRSSYEKKKLASYRIIAAAMVEAGQQEQEVMTRLLGRLSETGGPLIIAGTIENSTPWYEELFIRWQADNPLGARSFSMPTWSNTHIYPGGREDPEIKILESETPEDIFMERYAAVPRRKYGRVLPEFEMETHVRALTYDPSEGPVELAIDPARHCYAVLFVQHVGLYTHVLDRVYKRNVIAEEIIPEVMARPLWQYVDAGAAGVMDIAGKHHPGSASQIEIWKRDAGVTILPGKYQFQIDTIEVLRTRLSSNNVMKEPLIYFNNTMTNQTDSTGKIAMDVLAEPFLWLWPTRTAGQGNPKYPVDRNNDAMKALAYKIVHRYGTVMRAKKTVKRIQQEYWLAGSAMNKAAKRYARQAANSRAGRTY